jgi:hypothetical protein
MNESGINSFDEFLLFYLSFGFLVGLLWGILEADIVLGPVNEIASRRRRRQRLTRALAPLGALHVGFALLAADAARREPDDEQATDGHRRRAALEARLCLGIGLAVLALAAAPHLPGFDDAPGMTALVDAIPWEA